MPSHWKEERLGIQFYLYLLIYGTFCFIAMTDSPGFVKHILSQLPLADIPYDVEEREGLKCNFQYM